MSGTLEPMDRDARLAQEAVQALPEPRASAAFRARLREEFMAGAIQPKGAESRGRIVRGPWLDRVSRPALAWAAVAAVVLVTVGIRVGGSRPRWELAAVTGDGIAIVDRVPVPLGHRDQLEALLRPGVTIELPPTAQIEIMAAGTLAIQITPESRMVLPATPGRWFGRKIHGRLDRGELRITTGPRFAGTHFGITTPEAAVMVRGTTLAVIREPVGTCVCVLDGHVHVGPTPDGMEDVPAGRRRFIFNDGRAPEADVMRPNEHVDLAAFRDHSARAMSGSGAGPTP